MTKITYNHQTNECVVSWPSGKTMTVEPWRGQMLERSLFNRWESLNKATDFEVVHID